MSRSRDDHLRVLAHQKQETATIKRAQKRQAAALDDAISRTETLLDARGVERPRPHPQRSRRAAPALRPWGEILAEAQAMTPDAVSAAALLSEDDIQRIVRRHQGLEADFKALNRMDSGDWMLAGVAGVLAALVDVLLVDVPRHPGFLGGRPSKGGWLSNLVKEKFGTILPEDRIRSLERRYPVPFDASTSTKLRADVPGLGPGTHRFQSPGHDPLLGWVFGVRDVLSGEFTAFGKDGTLVIQSVDAPHRVGERLLTRVFSALQTVAGHQLSDVATPRGLPAPLMPLLLFIQTGSIGKQGYTVGEVSRQMYRAGYDFRHFLASSVPVMLIEIIVRIGFFARRIHEGAELAEAVPSASNARLRAQLLLSHSVATATNAGRVSISKNPLAINWSQWLAFFRYLLPQLAWLLSGSEEERAEHVRRHIANEWHAMDEEFAVLWRDTFDGPAAEL